MDKQTRCDYIICHVVSGHIDVYPDIKWFDSISYLKTPFFDKTVNYNLGVFSKNGIFGWKIKMVRTLSDYTSIHQVVT